MSDPFTKAMFGQHAVHIPMWMKVQQSSNTVVFVGASKTLDLCFGSERTHQLILGELIVRPHLVLGSDAFIGHGLSGLARECDIEKWLDGDLILDSIGRYAQLKNKFK